MFDGSGNPVSGAPVIFSVTVDPATEFMDGQGRPIFTDNNGRAEDVMRTRRTFSGTATVRAGGAGPPTALSRRGASRSRSCSVDMRRASLLLELRAAHAAVGAGRVGHPGQRRRSPRGLAAARGRLCRAAAERTAVASVSPHAATGLRPDEQDLLPSTGSDLHALARQAAERHGLAPELVLSVVATESGFVSDAVSPKGAAGLMQLMPATAAELGVRDVFDPAQNLDGGSRYLGALLKRYDGDVALSLAAYNAGPAAVARHDGIPPYPETRRYVNRSASARRSVRATVKRPARQAGYTLPAVLIMLSLMMVALGAAAPSWRYVMQNAREEELLFRGGQIADAIQRYQRKNGNAAPTSLDVLVEGRYLRQAYPDPMTEKGEWRLIRQGEMVGPVRARGSDSPRVPTTAPAGPGARAGRAVGGVMGVASRSTQNSLRVFNGRTRYDEWTFVAGQARVVGKPLTAVAPGAGPPPQVQPTPLRTP